MFIVAHTEYLKPIIEYSSFLEIFYFFIWNFFSCIFQVLIWIFIGQYGRIRIAARNSRVYQFGIEVLSNSVAQSYQTSFMMIMVYMWKSIPIDIILIKIFKYQYREYIMRIEIADIEQISFFFGLADNWRTWNWKWAKKIWVYYFTITGR